MRIRLIGIASGLAMLAPLAAFAQQTAPAPDSAPAAQAASAVQPDNQIVCSYSYYQGTIIRRPVCRTRHEWNRIRRYEQDSLRDFQLRTLQMPM